MARDGETLLAQKAKAGCKEAGSLLWSRQRHWLAAVLLAHMPREAELEDLLQEVALRYWSKLDSLEEPAKIRAWLRAIAVNVARSCGRRLHCRAGIVGALDEDSVVEAGLLANRERSRQQERAGEILELCHGLPLRYREPLLLKAMEGMSQKEIAEVLELPITTVGTRLARARRMLREEVVRAEDLERRDLKEPGAKPTAMERITCKNGRSRS